MTDFSRCPSAGIATGKPRTQPSLSPRIGNAAGWGRAPRRRRIRATTGRRFAEGQPTFGAVLAELIVTLEHPGLVSFVDALLQLYFHFPDVSKVGGPRIRLSTRSTLQNHKARVALVVGHRKSRLLLLLTASTAAEGEGGWVCFLDAPRALRSRRICSRLPKPPRRPSAPVLS